MATDGDPRTVQAVHKAVAIIELLQERNGMGVTELSAELDLSKATVHHHLSTLMEHELVVQQESMYRLSLRHLDFGETVKSRLGYYDVVTQELDDIAGETGELAQFATEEHGRAVYLYKARGEKAVQTASTIGKREYLHCISLGKAILAHLPEERVDEIVDKHGLERFTPQTISSRDELYERLERVRERGYAIDDEEKIEGLRCVAAPVLSDSDVLGAVSISGPSSRMRGERFEEELPEVVQRSANVIEINAKFT
jgi:DNA-binding IclR family transcriptional regulator